MSVELEKDILRTIAYYDIFRYPITEEEIHAFLGNLTPRAQLQISLSDLCREKAIYQVAGFYGLQDDPALIERRLRGNQQAAALLKTARRICRFLYNFPFVRGIAISGSLSKNFAEKNSDIDYFIITSPNRIWIARTILHAFKKITFLAGRQHRYCMNYFVDETALEIEEKNIFTAVEMVTLMPVCGNGCIEKIFKVNHWAMNRFPNYPRDKKALFENPSKPGLQRFFESLFNNRLGNWLEHYFMNLTARRWAAKEQREKLNMKGERMSLKTGRHFSKPNPHFFQQKVLSIYKNKLTQISKLMMATEKRDAPDDAVNELKLNNRPLHSGSFSPHLTPREPGL